MTDNEQQQTDDSKPTTTINDDGSVTLNADQAKALSEELATLRAQAKEAEAAKPITPEEQQRKWGSEMLAGLTGQPRTQTE